MLACNYWNPCGFHYLHIFLILGSCLLISFLNLCTRIVNHHGTLCSQKPSEYIFFASYFMLRGWGKRCPVCICFYFCSILSHDVCNLPLPTNFQRQMPLTLPGALWVESVHCTHGLWLINVAERGSLSWGHWPWAEAGFAPGVSALLLRSWQSHSRTLARVCCGHFHGHLRSRVRSEAVQPSFPRIFRGLASTQPGNGDSQDSDLGPSPSLCAFKPGGTIHVYGFSAASGPVASTSGDMMTWELLVLIGSL